MITIKRMAVLSATLVLVAVAVFGQVGRAASAPYGTSTLTVSVSTSDPCDGQQIVVRVSGGSPGDSVAIRVDSISGSVVTSIVDASGSTTGLIVIPPGIVGARQVVATDGVAVASATITIQGATSSGCAAAASGLPATGSDVVEIAAYACALLIAGTLLLGFGRRRENTQTDRGMHAAP